MDERQTKPQGRDSKPRSSRLLELARFGQSYWMDDLSRPMITSGELERRVAEEGLTGVTLNPSIFRAALHASDAYDRQIGELAGQSTSSIYEALIVTDVRDACDVLRPIYDRTDGRDGFVSIEVSPRLARNASASTRDASARLSRWSLKVNLYPRWKKKSRMLARSSSLASKSDCNSFERTSPTASTPRPWPCRNSKCG